MIPSEIPLRVGKRTAHSSVFISLYDVIGTAVQDGATAGEAVVFHVNLLRFKDLGGFYRQDRR